MASNCWSQSNVLGLQRQMEITLTRGWKRRRKEEKSSRSCLVCEPPTPSTLLNELSRNPSNIKVTEQSINTPVSSCCSLSGAEQVAAGAAGQAPLWAAAAGAQEETPGAQAERGEEACCCGGEAQAEAERGESKWWMVENQKVLYLRFLVSRLWIK